MLYTITVASPEVENFVLELQIESDATFHDLHSLIRRSCQWGDGEPAAFHICDQNWHRERTIPEESYELDVMADVELGDILEDEGQRMKYVFDAKARRLLLLEVSHISYGKHIDAPTCRRHRGEAPVLTEQLPASSAPGAPSVSGGSAAEPSASASNADLLAQLTAAALALDDEDDSPFADADGFDPDELDPEGFDITEM